MGKTREIQDGGVMLCETWKLYPIDDRNWELCELSTVEDSNSLRDKDAIGTTRWYPCGKYYSYNTVAQALLYVADVQLKRGCKDEAIDLRAVVDGLLAMAERMEKVRGVRW